MKFIPTNLKDTYIIEPERIEDERGFYDVIIIDLNPTSETYLQWTFVELTPENRKTLYVLR